MIRINLNSELKAPVDARTLYLAFVLIAITYIVCQGVPFLVSLVIDARTELLAIQFTEKSKEIAKLQLDVEQLKVLKNNNATLQSRLNTIRSLSRGRKQPVLLLDLLQRQHLDKMWLKGLKFETSKETEKGKVAKKIVQLNGVALDHLIVAEYVRRLKSVDDSTQTSLTDIRDADPNFIEPNSTAISSKSGDEIIQMKFSSVSLLKTDATNMGKLPVQSFDIEFFPTMP